MCPARSLSSSLPADIESKKPESRLAGKTVAPCAAAWIACNCRLRPFLARQPHIFIFCVQGPHVLDAGVQSRASVLR
jgi:hypothetical protein